MNEYPPKHEKFAVEKHRIFETTIIQRNLT